MRGDVLDRFPVVDHALERDELVGGVHGLSQRVFGCAGLERDVVVSDHFARHVDEVARESGFALQLQQRSQATAAGDDFENACIAIARLHGKVLQ